MFNITSRISRSRRRTIFITRRLQRFNMVLSRHSIITNRNTKIRTRNIFRRFTSIRQFRRTANTNVKLLNKSSILSIVSTLNRLHRFINRTLLLRHGHLRRLVRMTKRRFTFLILVRGHTRVVQILVSRLRNFTRPRHLTITRFTNSRINKGVRTIRRITSIIRRINNSLNRTNLTHNIRRFALNIFRFTDTFFSTLFRIVINRLRDTISTASLKGATRRTGHRVRRRRRRRRQGRRRRGIMTLVRYINPLLVLIRRIISIVRTLHSHRHFSFFRRTISSQLLTRGRHSIITRNIRQSIRNFKRTLFIRPRFIRTGRGIDNTLVKDSLDGLRTTRRRIVNINNSILRLRQISTSRLDRQLLSIIFNNQRRHRKVTRRHIIQFRRLSRPNLFLSYNGVDIITFLPFKKNVTPIIQLRTFRILPRFNRFNRQHGRQVMIIVRNSTHLRGLNFPLHVRLFRPPSSITQFNMNNNLIKTKFRMGGRRRQNRSRHSRNRRNRITVTKCFRGNLPSRSPIEIFEG